MLGKTSVLEYYKYEKAYESFLQGAFVEDKKSYHKLVEATIYWDRLEFDKAHKILDMLLDKCACTKDYLVVYTVKGICYAREGKNEPLIDVYKKMLQYDMANAQTWANLGWIYLKAGKTKEAYDAFNSAIYYNSTSAQAYNNMAIYYLKIADSENALKYALKAAELDPNIYQPMGTAAMAYKLLGDDDSAKIYLEKYALLGGDAKKLAMGISYM